MAEEANKIVNVTESFLPPESEFISCLDNIFKTHNLTNQGPYVRKLEKDLKEFLNVAQLVACANGTLALQLAIRFTELAGKKVITTPFTYVATLSSLLWEGCEPIFADIDPETLCLEPAAVEQALAEHDDVAGIMPVHVFGNACDVNSFEALARKYNLKIVYDAAHAFGSRLCGKSLLDYGDASACSFHATKIFHSVEGGCVVTPDPKDSNKLTLLRAFGHRNDNHIQLGINAKMSELHAAMGLCVLKYTPGNLEKRAKLAKIYDELLDMANSSSIKKPVLARNLVWNHAYYPVILQNEKTLGRLIVALNRENIYPRRYFFPSLTTLPYAPKQRCPIADDIANRILCLPFWADIPEKTMEKVARIVRENAE